MAQLKENHILIGLGGTGGKILRAFKMRMFEEFPNNEDRERQPVAFLYVDSTREMMGIGRSDMDVLGQDASFGENEFLYIKGVDVPELLDNIDHHPEIRGIVNNVSAVRSAIGNLGEAAGQKRRAGRLLFAVNARKYVDALKNSFSKCNDISHNNTKNIHIFAGLCGGTGSGSIIDAIVQARNISGWENAQINVYAMIPEQDLQKADMDKGRYYQNGYAALRELNALQCGRFQPSDVLGDGEPLDVFNERKHGVADGIALYSNANKNGHIVDSFTELPELVSDYVYSRIFLVSAGASECNDIIRAFNFENMDGSEFENDETIPPSQVMGGKELPKARTKKLYSFGVKRVIYPEMRILKHMTYSVGKKVLYQFRYNNWRQSLGFIDEELNFDYRAEYLKDETLSRWMLDELHLTLEDEVLTTKDGNTFDTFTKDWQSRVLDLADFCSDYECPPTELHRQMDVMFAENFRDEGVHKYFTNKLRSTAAIVAAIRSNIEKELFGKWRDGHISIVEQSRIGELLANYVATDLKKKLDSSVNDTKAKLAESDEALSSILNDWSHVGFFGKFVMKKKEDYYVDYQSELVNNLYFRTRLEAFAFARQLTSELQREIGKMSDDINSFSKMMSDAIDETKRLITAQTKKNKGLEDMSGPIIEVSEEERMIAFEAEISRDKEGMNGICRQIREIILPETEFKNFGDLMKRINVRTIKRAFDVKLSEIIQKKHADLPPSSTKILGLNILTQLQQKLGNNYQKIQEFAHDLLEQSEAYLTLDRNQIISNIRNNDQPDENKNINLREVLISIPSPDDAPSLQEFANDLRRAFQSQVEQGVKAPRIFMKSSRKNELSIITINYAFPMRAISWLAGYKRRYEKYLHTGNANQDLSRSILLHSEGLGENLPDIFAMSDAELRKLDEEKAQKHAATAPPPMPATPSPDPVMQMYLYVGGQQCGPYDYAALRQLVQAHQLTTDTLVWQQGMTQWAPAAQVEVLKPLFAPAPPVPGMPPLPPTPGSVPPPMNV